MRAIDVTDVSAGWPEGAYNCGSTALVWKIAMPTRHPGVAQLTTSWCRKRPERYWPMISLANGRCQPSTRRTVHSMTMCADAAAWRRPSRHRIGGRVSNQCTVDDVGASGTGARDAASDSRALLRKCCTLSSHSQVLLLISDRMVARRGTAPGSSCCNRPPSNNWAIACWATSDAR